MTTIIDYKESNYHTLLQRGIPKAVLRSCGFELNKVVEGFSFKSNNRVTQILTSKQIDKFNQTLKDKFNTNWLYCISGKSDPVRARACACMLFDKFLTKQIKKENQGQIVRYPLWHKIYTGFNDKLRDDKQYRERMGIPGFLVLDTVYKDISNSNLNKVRELLDMYSDVPRVVVGTGTDPIDLCRNVLFQLPTKVLYIADSFDVVQY